MRKFLDFWIFGCLGFWVFGFLEFWSFEFLDFGTFGFVEFLDFGFLDFRIFGFLNFGFCDGCILDPYTCGYLDTRNCISVYRRCQGWIILPSIYMHHIYIHIHTHMCMNTHHWLNQAFAVAEGYLANRIMVHCLVPVLIKMMKVRILIIVHCLATVLIATMIVKYWCRYGYTSVITNSNK